MVRFKNFAKLSAGVVQTLNRFFSFMLNLEVFALLLFLTLVVWSAYGWLIGIAIPAVVVLTFWAVDAGINRLSQKARETTVPQRHFPDNH